MLWLSQTIWAQVPDFIAVKKRNGITIQNFYAGQPITFETYTGGEVDGPIDRIINDSIYIKFFNIKVEPTIWGTRIYDTVSTYIVPFHYKAIRTIKIPTIYKRRGALGRLSTYLQVGGAGYLALNLINGAILGERVSNAHNLTKLAIASGVYGAGYFLKRQYNPRNNKSKKYTIEYVHMQ